MLADKDNPLEPDGPQPPTDPLVMVVYRSRGVPWVILPPLLLLAAVLGVIAYRKSDESFRDRALLAYRAAASNPTPTIAGTEPSPALPAAATIEPPSPASATGPAAPSPSESTKPPEVTPSIGNTPAEPAPSPLAVNPPRREPVGFDPEAVKLGLDAPGPLAGAADGPGPAPVVDPPVRAFEAEAGPVQPEAGGAVDPGEFARTRAEAVARSRRRAAEDRAPFHLDLKRAIADLGNRAGPEIRALADRYGRDSTPEILRAVEQDLNGPAVRLSPSGRIQRMRRWGIPESIILDDLANTQLNDHRARGGPRNEGEIFVRAAKILLAFPPNPTKAVAAPATVRDGR